MGIKDDIDKFMEILPTLTKEEADFILDIINWPDEKKAAFKFAKQVFEGKD